MIKLSIITINYNNTEGLRKTLASVAAQTYWTTSNQHTVGLVGQSCAWGIKE